MLSILLNLNYELLLDMDQPQAWPAGQVTPNPIKYLTYVFIFPTKYEKKLSKRKIEINFLYLKCLISLTSDSSPVALIMTFI